MGKNYGMELVQATELAALTAALRQGHGRPNALLEEARQVMLGHVNGMSIRAYVHNDRFSDHQDISAFPEFVGKGGEEFDLITCAVDGHKSCAEGMNNVASFVAMAPRGGFLHLPNARMYKIAVGCPNAHEVIDINESVTVNIMRLARALNKQVENTSVCVLKRLRHLDIIKEIRACGARIVSISDGDISASIATVTNADIDMYIGIGGAQEGVMTAAILGCIGGYITGKIHCLTEAERKEAEQYNLSLEKVYGLKDLCPARQIYTAGTGITQGTFLDGVKPFADGAETSSFVVRSKTMTQRYLRTRHYFDYKPIFHH